MISTKGIIGIGGSIAAIAGLYYYFTKWIPIKVPPASNKDIADKRIEGINAIVSRSGSPKKLLVSFPIRKSSSKQFFSDGEALAYGLNENTISTSPSEREYLVKVTSIGKLLPNGTAANLTSNDKVSMPPIGKVFKITDEYIASISEWNG